MSSLTSFVSEAYEDHLSFVSVEAIIDGVTITALPAEAELSPDLDIGGVSDQADGAIIARVSDFQVLPKVGSRIQVDGDVSRIRSIQRSAGNPLVTIEYSGYTER